MTNASGLMAQARMALDRTQRHGHVESANLLAGIVAMIGALERGERPAMAAPNLAHALALFPVNDNLVISR